MATKAPSPPAPSKPVTPPAAPAPAPLLTPPAAPEPQANIKDFKPEPFNVDFENGPTSKAEIPPQGPPAEPAPSPEALEQRRKDNDSLRTNLEESNRRIQEHERQLAERQQELEAERDRLKKLEEERDGVRSERDKLRGEFDEFRRSTGKVDPLTDPDIIKLNQDFESSVKNLDRGIALAGGKATKLKELVPQLLQQYRNLGEPESVGFDDRRDELNRVLDENFPEKKHDAILDLLGNGVKAWHQVQEKIQQIEKDGDGYRSAREQEMFRSAVANYETMEREFFNPSADVRQNDPYNAEVIVSELFGLSDETKAGKKNLLQFVREVILPQQPINPADLAKMSDEDRARYLTGRNQSRAALQQKLHRMLPTAIASQMFLPQVYKKMMEYKKELEALRGLEPPPPDGRPHDEGATEQPKDIKEFKPQNTLLDSLNTGRG